MDHFTDWLADKADQCQLRNRIDYEEVFREKVKNPVGGRPKREVVLTLNAAKEIGMAARGDYGKRLRRYFLDCEFRLPARLFIEDAMARRAGGGAPGGPADRETYDWEEPGEAEPGGETPEAPTEVDAGAPQAGAEDFARLVPVEERDLGGRQVLTVLASDLYAALGPGRQYAHWLADQIDRCRLRVGQDYAERIRATSPDRRRLRPHDDDRCYAPAAGRRRSHEAELLGFASRRLTKCSNMAP